MSNSLGKIISADEKVLRLNKTTSSINSRVNVTELVKECKTMLLSRKYRTFDRTVLKNAVNKTADWAGEVASHRARLADIHVEAVDSKMRLDELIKLTQRHLSTALVDKTKTFGTAKAKTAAIDTSLEGPIKTKTNLDRLIKIVEIVQKELEASNFNAILIKQLSEMVSRTEGYNT